MHSQSNTKTCSKCNQEKLRSEFYRHSGSRDGLKGYCKECGKQAGRQYYQVNKDRHAEASRRWIEANRERYEAYQRRYREEHAEKRRAYFREYHKTYQRKPLTEDQARRNRERARQFYADNKQHVIDRNRGWRWENREKIYGYHQSRKARKNGSLTVAEFNALCEQYGDRCLRCGEKKPLEADHVIPLVKGGRNDIANIQPLCRTCNATKQDRDWDFRGDSRTIPLRQLHMFE